MGLAREREGSGAADALGEVDLVAVSDRRRQFGRLTVHGDVVIPRAHACSGEGVPDGWTHHAGFVRLGGALRGRDRDLNLDAFGFSGHGALSGVVGVPRRFEIRPVVAKEQAFATIRDSTAPEAGQGTGRESRRDGRDIGDTVRAARRLFRGARGIQVLLVEGLILGVVRTNCEHRESVLVGTHIHEKVDVGISLHRLPDRLACFHGVDGSDHGPCTEDLRAVVHRRDRPDLRAGFFAGTVADDLHLEASEIPRKEHERHGKVVRFHSIAVDNGELGHAQAREAKRDLAADGADAHEGHVAAMARVEEPALMSVILSFALAHNTSSASGHSSIETPPISGV